MACRLVPAGGFLITTLPTDNLH